MLLGLQKGSLGKQTFSEYLLFHFCRYRWAKAELDRDEVFQVRSCMLSGFVCYCEAFDSDHPW